jgi:hypothetical protein
MNRATRDPYQLAKSIIDIATGQKPDRDPEADRGNKHKFVASASIKEYAESFRRGIVQTTTTPAAHRLGGRMSKQIRSHLPNQMIMIAPAVI